MAMLYTHTRHWHCEPGLGRPRMCTRPAPARALLALWAQPRWPLRFRDRGGAVLNETGSKPQSLLGHNCRSFRVTACGLMGISRCAATPHLPRKQPGFHQSQTRQTVGIYVEHHSSAEGVHNIMQRRLVRDHVASYVRRRTVWLREAPHNQCDEKESDERGRVCESVARLHSGANCEQVK